FVYGAPHNGLTASGQTESGITPTFPYHQRYTRLSIVSSVNTGFNLANITDATLSNCLGFGNAGNNFSLQNNSNSVLIACRAEWSSGGRGFDITGSSGSIVFSGCTTDQNASEGLRIHSATGQSTQGGGIVWTGGKLHADGNGGTNNNGIIVTSSTVPVTITGVNVESGQNPNSSNYYPANAITLTSSSNVVVADSVLQGISSAWNDTGGNSFLVRKACLGMTGNPNTQTTSSLIDLPSSNVPLPSDQNLIAWTYDPALQTASSTPTSGVLYLCRINIRQTTTITNLLLCVAAAPSGLTASENSAGLYNSSGTLLSNVGDQTTNWGTTGLKTMGLGAAQTVAPGIYYLGFLANASTTTPGFGRSTVQSAGTVNAGTTASTPRWSTFGTGQTVLPSSVTISSSTVANTAYWAAFS